MKEIAEITLPSTNPIIPETATQSPPHELSRQQEVSQSFTKLKTTLEARLRKISESTHPQTQTQEQIPASEPQEQSSTLTESQPEEQKKPRPKEAACAEALLKILRTQNLSELNGSNFDLIVNFGNQDKQDLKSVRITIVDGKISISGVVGEDGTVTSLSEGQKIRDLDEENKHLTILTENLVKTVFPNLSPQEYQALTSTILGQETGQIEDLAHSLGYLTRDDLGEILGIPKNKEQRDTLLATISDKRFKKAMEEAAIQIYGSEGKPPEIAEIPEAQGIITVLEKAGIQPNKNLQQIVENIKEYLNSRFGDKANEQPLMLLIAKLEQQIGKNNKTLAEIITDHYSTLESGEIPEDNLEELLPTIKQLYDVNGNINEQKARELKDKVFKTGKTIGIGAALIFAIMLWQGMRKSQGR